MSGDRAEALAPSMAPEITAWDLFVLRHRKPWNLRIHFLSFLLYYGSLGALAWTWNPWWVAGLFASGALGSLGHWLTGDGAVKVKEATWDPLVPLFVTIMFLRIAQRRYAAEVARAEARLAAWQAHGAS